MKVRHLKKEFKEVHTKYIYNINILFSSESDLKTDRVQPFIFEGLFLNCKRY